MSNRRIAILCGGAFAFPSLLKLSMEKFLCGVALANNHHALVENLRAESEKLSYPFLHIGSKNDVALLDNWLDAVKPDAVFSICFPYKIPGSTLSKAPNGFFNFHPGPLPAFRGPSPIFEILKRREKQSAIAVHFMTADYDSGNIVFTEKVNLSPDENYQSLTLKLSSRCGIAVQNLAEMITFSSGNFKGVKQDESAANFYPFPSEKDLVIEWNEMDAENIIALIRACHSWTRGAITWMGDEQLRIPQATISTHVDSKNELPGTVTAINENGSCLVACRDNKMLVIPVFSTDFGDLGMDYMKSLGFGIGVRLTSGLQ